MGWFEDFMVLKGWGLKGLGLESIRAVSGFFQF